MASFSLAPEYNFGSIDWPQGRRVVSYGSAAGVRSVQQLREAERRRAEAHERTLQVAQIVVPCRRLACAATLRTQPAVAGRFQL